MKKTSNHWLFQEWLGKAHAISGGRDRHPQMDYGEGNKIITLCTKESGKVGVLVRGAKKVKSRHVALTRLFTYGEYVFFRNGTGLGNLNAGEIMESHHGLREDLIKAAYASYACELLDRVRDEETGAFGFISLRPAWKPFRRIRIPKLSSICMR